MSDQSSDMPRRDFLNLAWGSMALLAAAGSGFVGLRFLTSQVADGEFGGIVTAGVVADFPPGSVTPFPNGRFYLVRRADGGFVAVSHRCTHLACVVLWQQGEQQFYCPCHGSRFSPDGDVLNPPASSALARFPVTIARDQVLVDTGTLISRGIVEPDDIAYPDVGEAGS